MSTDDEGLVVLLKQIEEHIESIKQLKIQLQCKKENLQILKDNEYYDRLQAYDEVMPIWRSYEGAVSA